MTKKQALVAAQKSSFQNADFCFACKTTKKGWILCNWLAGIENFSFYMGKQV